jgi:poly-gamma-glutamate synthesis protein (capsule biosynthesis protein)
MKMLPLLKKWTFAAVCAFCLDKAGLFSQSLTMVAVGDDLMHDSIIKAARMTAGSPYPYDFEPIYVHIKPLIEAADIAFINQESPIAGESFGISGYPDFNGPFDIGRAVVNTGFDVVNLATNHVMDKGEEALLAMLDYWDKQPSIIYLGAARSAEAYRQDRIIEKNGIKVGFLSYTYGVNGGAAPRNGAFVSFINNDRIAHDVDALRPKCDFLAVSLHWGIEYNTHPSKQQESLAALLARHNVDLVIGHHPHVLQPVRVLPRSDGGSLLCYYSLGNFVSSQWDIPALLGGMMQITLVKADGKVRIDKADLLPLVTHYNRGFTGYTVYRLDEYTDALAARHGIPGEARAQISVKRFTDIFNAVYKDSVFALP